MVTQNKMLHYLHLSAAQRLAGQLAMMFQEMYKRYVMTDVRREEMHIYTFSKVGRTEKKVARF